MTPTCPTEVLPISRPVGARHFFQQIAVDLCIGPHANTIIAHCLPGPRIGHPGSDLGRSLSRRRKNKIGGGRSEEHTSELQSLMRISYAAFCLKKKNTHTKHKVTNGHT